MSDEERPRIDTAALREHIDRMRREADANAEARARAETDELLASISAFASRQVEAFLVLPCRGEIARIGECSDDYASVCERRTTPSCPRSIAALDAEQAASELRERLRVSGVPHGVLDVLERGFRPTEATQAVDEWLASGKRLLLLAGSFGTGKSVAAGYAIKRRAGRWMHASEIAKASRFEHEARMSELQRARLLVIDDVGAEFNDASGWGRAHLTELLLLRFEDKRDTVMTSNLGPDAWKSYADPRIADRLGGVDGQVFGAAGKSMRRRT